MCAKVPCKISYHADPGEDITFRWEPALYGPKFTVSAVAPGGAASDANLKVGAELVDSPLDTNRLLFGSHGLSLRTAANLCRTALTYPLTLTFEGPQLGMTSKQFELVCRKDLDVPLVAISSDRRVQNAKFVINSFKRAFHTKGVHSTLDCPTFEDGLCFCGVHELYEALIDELDKTFKTKFSTYDRRWMDIKKMKLLQHHRNAFKLGSLNTAVVVDVEESSVASEARTALVLKPREDEVQLLFQSYLTDQVSTLTPEKQRAVLLAERIAEEMDKDRRTKTKATDPRAAWLGDRLNDSYLAVHGYEHGLSPHQLDQVRQKKLSAQGLSGGLGRDVAENVESQVGFAAEPHLQELARLLQSALGAVRVPPGNETILESLQEAIAHASGREKHQGNPANPALPPVRLVPNPKHAAQRASENARRQ
ncbi:unnamed protein product, partial [Symbiodinium sp. CCMP2592]